MFGLGSRNGAKEMKDLLVKVQGQLSIDGLGQEMRVYQHGFVEKTKTFVAYGESFPSEGYTAAGGLAKYCNNVFQQTVDAIDRGMPPMPIIIDLAEKMAYVALSIDRVVSENDLRDKDKIMITSAMKMAHVWLTHDKRMELLRKVEDILADMGSEFKNEGVMKAAMNGEKYVKKMTAW